MLINNTWFLIISSYAGIAMPYKIHKYISNGVAQFCAHSHPYDGRFNSTNTPSVSDLGSYSLDGLSYIISKEGFTEIDNSKLDSNIIEYIEKVRNCYLGEKSSNEYILFMNSLYDLVGINRRKIAYTDIKQITDIISSKYDLKTSFWDTDVSKHRVLFPNSHK